MKFILLLAAIPLSIAATSGQGTVLTLQEFLLLVEQQHPALQSANYEPDIAEAEIRSALGRFDPMLSFQYDSKLKSGDDKVSTIDGSLELPLDMMFGPKLKANYRRGQGFQIDPEALTTPAGEASLGFALPVFQGVFTDARRNALRKAMLRPNIARAQFTIERNALLRTASLRYWDWCEATQQRLVADSLLSIARVRLDFVRRRSSAGETATIDTVEALQEVLRREGERIRAERIEEQVYLDVYGMLWNARQPYQNRSFSSQVLPTTFDTPDNADSIRNRARLVRPEIQRASFMVETSRFDSSLASEFMRPFVEIDAGLISYDVSKPNAVDYKVGLRVQQPLLFRQASAQLQTTSIAVDRAQITLTLIERLVDIDVDIAFVGYRKALERVDVAVREVTAAQAMVSAEQSRFVAGDSSLLLVNIRERMLSEALQRLVSARADVMRAQANLAWATGVI
jgi:outer membrane protein TolC